ncbi:hypothetical protein BW730_05920 [Tessaracoccus aquimaris]|uniref:Uncharacterized protein n=1 Tax=Tessaracoccus aquimaris TaxID=1332264 RepID=A0A1Q2CLZ3_9ACTN|nr:KDGP aldolase [Tessaracoccus aquimaris]AQP47121.1 hypothetical protein BW730_05920 [Tessaracoccus aquimaris]
MHSSSLPAATWGGRLRPLAPSELTPATGRVHNRQPCVSISIFEPTGGIAPDNFEQVVGTCLEAGATHVVPHVYTSIVDPSTGETIPDEVAALAAVAARLATS